MASGMSVYLNKNDMMADLQAEIKELFDALDELAGFVSDQFGDPKSDDGWRTEEARDAWMKARAALMKSQSSR